MSKTTIIFGIISIICMIIMIILYINLNYKISNTLTLDKLKVKDIEIDKSINVNPNLLIKGTFDYNNDKFKNFDKNKIKIFYIKNDEDTSNIPMELHLDELLYLIYTTKKNKFIENSENDDEIDDEQQDINKTEENTEENTEEQINEPAKEESSNDTKETFKNIPGYNIYYY